MIYDLQEEKKCAIINLQKIVNRKSEVSGRRGSNSRPTAWKAVALPIELLPLKFIRDYEN